jgi:NTE family protein
MYRKRRVMLINQHTGDGNMLGIALSGGGARGFAHLGVLKAMQEVKLSPDIISGVSAGSIVGAFYADGYAPEEILEMFIKEKLYHLIHMTIPREGFLRPSGLHELIRDYLRAENFEDLGCPLYIAATNLNTGKIEYFNSGPLREVIIASASIPILFRPVKINGFSYVDGGVIDNLPVKPLQGKCGKIMGVNVNPLYEEYNLKNIIQLAERTFYLNIVSNSREHIRDCDLYIEPQSLKGFGIFEISKAREIFEIGYREATRCFQQEDDTFL